MNIHTYTAALARLMASGLSYGVTKTGGILVAFGGDVYALNPENSEEFDNAISVLRAKRERGMRECVQPIRLVMR